MAIKNGNDGRSGSRLLFIAYEVGSDNSGIARQVGVSINSGDQRSLWCLNLFDLSDVKVYNESMLGR